MSTGTRGRACRVSSERHRPGRVGAGVPGDRSGGPTRDRGFQQHPRARRGAPVSRQRRRDDAARRGTGRDAGGASQGSRLSVKDSTATVTQALLARVAAGKPPGSSQSKGQSRVLIKLDLQRPGDGHLTRELTTPPWGLELDPERGGTASCRCCIFIYAGDAAHHEVELWVSSAWL